MYKINELENQQYSYVELKLEAPIEYSINLNELIPALLNRELREEDLDS